MAEETKAAVAETVSANVDMEVELPNGHDSAGNGDSKRPREEGPGTEQSDEDLKKQKVEQSAGNIEGDQAVTVSLGPKSFESGVEMFDYFYKFLHHWPTNLDVNEYEHMVLLDLIKKGHPEPEKKIGSGIQSFQVRFHPTFKSKCYFIIRDDEVVDDFSFRKCVDHILPLPADMKARSEVDRALGGGRGRGGRGGQGRGGRGRGGRGRY